MDIAVHHHAVINFIRKDNEIVLTSNFHNFQQKFLRIKRSRWIVRVDDNDSLGIRCDFWLDVVNIWIPFCLLITDIVNSIPTSQTDCSRPEWVVWHWYQHLISVIQQSLHGHDNQLADTISQINIINIYIRKILKLAVLHDSLTGWKNPLGVRVTLTVTRIHNQIMNDLIWSGKTKFSRIPCIEAENLFTTGPHAHSFIQNWTANIIGNMFQLAGLVKFFHSYFSSIHQNVIIIPPEKAIDNKKISSLFTRLWSDL